MDSDVIIGSSIGAAIGLVAGIPLSLIGQRYVATLSRDSKRLGIEILSANVIIPRLSKDNPNVRLMVRQSAMSQDGNPTALVDVDEVFGFRIRLRNSGTVELLDQPVYFNFPAGTKVILADFEKSPAFGDSIPMFEIDKGSSQVTARFPFLNPRDEAIVSIQTVLNPTVNCKVTAVGPGLSTYDIAKQSARKLIISLVTMTLSLAIAGGAFLGAAAWVGWESDTGKGLKIAGFILLIWPYVVVALGVVVGVMAIVLGLGRLIWREVTS